MYSLIRNIGQDLDWPLFSVDECTQTSCQFQVGLEQVSLVLLCSNLNLEQYLVTQALVSGFFLSPFLTILADMLAVLVIY